MPTSYSWTVVGDPVSGSAPNPGPGVPGVPQFKSSRSTQFQRGIKFGNVPGGNPDNMVHGGTRIFHVNTVMNTQQTPSDKSNLSGVIRYKGDVRPPITVRLQETRGLDAFGNVAFPGISVNFGIAAPPVVVQTSLTGGVLAYWKFEGNSNDTVGSSNGVDTLVQYGVPGQIGQAMYLSGTSSYISVSASALLQPSQFTIATWVKHDSVIGAYRTIFSSYFQDINTYTAGFKIFKEDSNRLGVIVGNKTNFVQGSGYEFLTSSLTMSQNVWAHVAATYDGSTIKLYVNGTADGTRAFSGMVYHTASHVGIGVFYFDNSGVHTTSQPFKGVLDEMGLWNRALSQAEITNLYNSGSGRTYPF